MKLVSTEKAPKALGPYSQGYVHGGILYSAGQIAINPATDTVEADTIEGQADQVCKNIGAILEEAGTSFDKVLKTTRCFRKSCLPHLTKFMQNISHQNQPEAVLLLRHFQRTFFAKLK